MRGTSMNSRTDHGHRQWTMDHGLWFMQCIKYVKNISTYSRVLGPMNISHLIKFKSAEKVTDGK